MSERTPYDRELGKITRQDQEYASDLLDDLEEYHSSDREARLVTAAQWLRKARYEAVIADRKTRSPTSAERKMEK